MATKSAYITIRVSQETKDLISAMAKHEERTVSNVAVRLLNAELKRLASGIKKAMKGANKVSQ